jgi:hypothetical protein
MKATRCMVRIALVLVATAWSCRLLWMAVPALDRTTNHAAEVLYLAELGRQRDAMAGDMPATLETIAALVHQRTAGLLLWIGAGLALCVFAAVAPRWQRTGLCASGMLFLAGWIGFDAYVYSGLWQGLDLKLRLVQQHPPRLLQFIVFDVLLPLAVALAEGAMLISALDGRIKDAGCATKCSGTQWARWHNFRAIRFRVTGEEGDNTREARNITVPESDRHEPFAWARWQVTFNPLVDAEEPTCSVAPRTPCRRSTPKSGRRCRRRTSARKNTSN